MSPTEVFQRVCAHQSDLRHRFLEITRGKGFIVPPQLKEGTRPGDWDSALYQAHLRLMLSFLLEEVYEAEKAADGDRYPSVVPYLTKVNVVEELVDVLHFLADLALETGVKPSVRCNPETFAVAGYEWELAYRNIAWLGRSLRSKPWQLQPKESSWEEFQLRFNALVSQIMSGILFWSNSQDPGLVLVLYLRKNQINHQRINNGT